MKDAYTPRTNGFYNDAGDYFLIRSYIASGDNGEFKDAVLNRLKAAYDVENIDHEYIEMDFGNVIAYSYDIMYQGEIEDAWREYNGRPVDPNDYRVLKP